MLIIPFLEDGVPTGEQGKEDGCKYEPQVDENGDEGPLWQGSSWLKEYNKPGMLISSEIDGFEMHLFVTSNESDLLKRISDDELEILLKESPTPVSLKKKVVQNH